MARFPDLFSGLDCLPLDDFSFLSNFAKRNFTVNDQIKIIREFLEVGPKHLPCVSLCKTFPEVRLPVVHYHEDEGGRAMEKS